MTIRRQYQLPNCSLVLDGLSIDPSPGSEDVMSLLVNAECRISGLERSLNGGYNFFAALVRAVSQYAQEVLSGFAHPQVVEGEPLLVHINPGDGPYHHLVVQPEIADIGEGGDGRAIDIKLSAVQLFDLTEAVDQFFADHQTLPELEPALSPLARKFVRNDEPLSERMVPAVLGVGGLVAATMALGLLPVPELRDPTVETSEQIESIDVVAEGDADSLSSGDPGEPDDDVEVAAVPLDEAASEASAEEEADEATEAIAEESDVDADAEETEETTSEAEDETDEVAELEEADLESDSEEDDFEEDDSEEADEETRPTIAAEGGNNSVTTARVDEEPPVAIRGLADVRSLNSQLKQKIVENREQPRFGDAVSYRVRMSEDGRILGYRPIDSSADSAVDETPLPELVENASEETPAVDYRVVFTERGVVEVGPWLGWSYYE